MTPKKLLFVCMGNICRSPAAESVMRHLIKDSDLKNHVMLDSAGTTGFHSGDGPDARMVAAGQRRNIVISGTARRVTVEDLKTFDLILAMDRDNLKDLRMMDPGQLYTDKIKLFGDFCVAHKGEEVPDPYYGGTQGFEKVLDMLDDGCRGLIEMIEEDLAVSLGRSGS